MCRGNNHGGRRCPVTPEVRSKQNRAYYLKRKAAGTVGQSLGVKPHHSTPESAAAAPVSGYESIPDVTELGDFVTEQVGQWCYVSLEDDTASEYSDIEDEETITEANRLAKLIGEGFSAELVSNSGKSIVCKTNTVKFSPEGPQAALVEIKGLVEVGGEWAGVFIRKIKYNARGETYMEYNSLELNDGYQKERIGTQLIKHFDAATKATGIDTVKTLANVDIGGYAWAKAGYDWDLNPDSLEEKEADGSLYGMNNIRDKLVKWWSNIEDDDEEIAPEKREVSNMLHRLEGNPEEPNYPTPYEVAMCGREFPDRNGMWAGKRALLWCSWYGVRKL